MIRDWLFLFFANCEFNKYPSCSVTKRKSVSFIEKLELIIDIRDFITYFFSWFSVSRRFRKMRFWKCQMRMMRFGNCYLHLSFPFRHFQAFLSDTFLAPLLFALEQDEKPYFTCWYRHSIRFATRLATSRPLCKIWIHSKQKMKMIG